MLKGRTPLERSNMLHDYSQGKHRWGWSYSFVAGGPDWFSAIGWGEGLKVGDEILTTLRKTINIRYVITDITYKRDPQDMWEARFDRVIASDNPEEPT